MSAATAPAPAEARTARRWSSVDWKSLTFTGERHEVSLRIPGPDSARAVALLRDGLAEAEWPLRAMSLPTS